MPGEWIKPQQVVLYMKVRKENYTQKVSVAKAGISERSGRNIKHNERIDPRRMLRWRSRPDPLKAVWESELKPMLGAPGGVYELVDESSIEEARPVAPRI